MLDSKLHAWESLPLPLQQSLQEANAGGPLVHKKLQERSASQMLTYLNVVYLRLNCVHTAVGRSEHEAGLKTLKRACDFAEQWTRKAFPRT